MSLRKQPIPGPQGPTGPPGGLIGTNSTTNPVYGDSGNIYGSSLSVTYDTTGLTNPGFTNECGFDISQVSYAGQNVYGGGTNAKKTLAPLNVSHTAYAAGQRFGTLETLTSYGMGDCFMRNSNVTFAGANISGDEGTGFCSVSALLQQQSLALYTVQTVARSSANTTTTQSITASKTAQTVSVVSVSGISVNDWVVVGQAVPTGNINIEAIQVTAVDTVAKTITGIFSCNQISGVSILPALVMRLNNGNKLGEQRVLINHSGVSYSTGTVSSITGGAFTGSGTSWSNSIVGGDSLNIGAITLAADNYSSSPFNGSGGSGTLKDWYQIISVSDATHLGIFSYSVAGDQSYKGNGPGSGAYIIQPAARILRIISATTVVCEYSAHTWTVGDSLELAIAPYPDVTGFSYQVGTYSNGGTYRGFMGVTNVGARNLGTAFGCDANMPIGSDVDLDGWTIGFTAANCKWGIVSRTNSVAALRLGAEFYGDVTDRSGAFIWGPSEDDPPTGAYLIPNSDIAQRGLSFRPFMLSTANPIKYYASSSTGSNGRNRVEHNAVDLVLGSSYMRVGSFTVSQANSLGANNAGSGALIWVSDLSGGAGPAMSDGTNWKKIALGATIS